MTGESRVGGRGFTLIELAAVLFIMGILAALAIGYTGGVNDRVNDANVEQLLNTVVGAQQEYAFKTGTWAKDALTLEVGRSAEVIEGTADEPGEVSMAVSGTTVVIATLSTDGVCKAKRLGDPLLDSTPSDIVVPAATPCSAGLLLGVQP